MDKAKPRGESHRRGGRGGSHRGRGSDRKRMGRGGGHYGGNAMAQQHFPNYFMPPPPPPMGGNNNSMEHSRRVYPVNFQGSYYAGLGGEETVMINPSDVLYGQGFPGQHPPGWSPENFQIQSNLPYIRSSPNVARDEPLPNIIDNISVELISKDFGDTLNARLRKAANQFDNLNPLTKLIDTELCSVLLEDSLSPVCNDEKDDSQKVALFDDVKQFLNELPAEIPKIVETSMPTYSFAEFERNSIYLRTAEEKIEGH